MLIGDKVIFRDEETVSCINLDTGKALWHSGFGDHYSGGVTCSGDGIVACASDQTLGLFDLDTGEEVFRTKFPIRSGVEYGFYSSIKKAPGRIYTHPLVSGDKQIYVFTSDGVLWALRPKL